MKYITYILVAFYFCSCIKEIDIDIPASDSKIVLGALLQHGKEIEVIVSQTQPSNDTAYTIVDDVKISIESEDKTYALTRLNEYAYTCELIALANQNYRITASAQGYDKVSAFDSIPSPINFYIDNYLPTAFVNYEGDNYSSITVNITDIPESDCYFELRLQCQSSFFDKIEYYYADLSSDDIVIRDEGLINETYGKVGLIFSNRLITDTYKKITFSFMNLIGDEYNKIDKVQVQLRNTSYDYYLYKQKLYLNLDAQESDIWDGTGNPVDAYSNINNGYGIFAGFSQTSQDKEL